MMKRTTAFAAVIALLFFAVPASAQFLDQGTYVVGAGSANAQTATIPNASSYADLTGVIIKLNPGANNTGAATFNVNSFGAVAVRAPTSGGLAALVGGEIVVGQPIELIYDGTYFDILSPINLQSGVTPGTYVGTKLSVNAAGQITAASNASYPTRQILTVGSGTYTTPAGAKRIFIRMIGAGGGGGGCGTGAGAGANGTASSFNSITANPGQGAVAVTSGISGGTGGAGGTGGSGSAYLRISGGTGITGIENSPGVFNGNAGPGAVSPFGGGGSTTYLGAGGAAQAATGSGGGGGAMAGSSSIGNAAGGGAGEYVEIQITNPAASYSYTVGAKGAGGTIGTGGSAGGNGADGTIIVDEYYN